MTKKKPIQANSEMSVEEAAGIIEAIVYLQTGIHKLNCISDVKVQEKLALEGIEYFSRVFQHIPKDLATRAAELFQNQREHK